jgi:hypothetical protein
MIRRTAVGIDPGARWTGLVLRDELRPINGATVGPRSPAGELEPSRIEDVFKSDPAKFVARVRRYTLQVCDVVDQLVTLGKKETGDVPVIAVERYEYNHRKMAGVSWLVPMLVVQGILVRYPDARLVKPSQVGDVASYPHGLRGKHPERWLVKDEPTNRRGHEQSAWDVAGAALVAVGGAL